jgi:hypothetical protein
MSCILTISTLWINRLAYIQAYIHVYLCYTCDLAHARVAIYSKIICILRPKIEINHKQPFEMTNKNTGIQCWLIKTKHNTLTKKAINTNTPYFENCIFRTLSSSCVRDVQIHNNNNGWGEPVGPRYLLQLYKLHHSLINSHL